MNRELVRVLSAEAIGTFALVFAGCGAIMVDAKTHQLGHVGVAITFGLVIMFGIYAVGHISGAHFNPAVTFAFALTRHFPWPRGLAYLEEPAVEVIDAEMCELGGEVTRRPVAEVMGELEAAEDAAEAAAHEARRTLREKRKAEVHAGVEERVMGGSRGS